LTLGLHENFPINVHLVEGFKTTVSAKRLQEKILRTLCELNRGEFTFEEVANPTFPQGKVLFEFGLAKDGGFSYLNEEELKISLAFLNRERLEVLDFFCSIRYYKISRDKKTPLKFDYFFFRAFFPKELLEVHVYHERGPRYVSPADLVSFIVDNLNKMQSKKILKVADQ
jgi:hypothetical protein